MRERELADAMADAASAATRRAQAAGHSRSSRVAIESAKAAAIEIYVTWTGHQPDRDTPHDPVKERMES